MPASKHRRRGKTRSRWVLSFRPPHRQLTDEERREDALLEEEGLCDADVLRASQLQHSVQYVDRDGHLARLSPVRLRTQPVTDDALPARDIGLHQSAPAVP
jgi:hypothetical protein